nr:colicin immunity protein Cui [Providencia sp. PROV145]
MGNYNRICMLDFKINAKVALFVIVSLGAIPLAAIWLNVIPKMTIININDWMNNVPVIYSDSFPDESYLSALYCKIAPFFSILYYILVWNSIKLKKEHFKLYNSGVQTLIFGHFSAILIISTFVYINYYLNYNMSTGNRKISSISNFEFTSFLYYYTIFLSVFITTCTAINIFLFLPIKYKQKRWG